MRGLDWQTLTLPLAVGLQTKDDPRMLPATGLAVAREVQFDETGAITTRYPYGALSSSIHPSSTIVTFRKVVANGDELLLFTEDKLYSWNAKLSKWVLKGTHLAVKVEEESTFVTTGDQVMADRAELLGTAIYVWQDDAAAWVAAVDTVTGQVMVSPQHLVSGAGHLPKVIALTTKILVLYQPNAGSTSLVCKAIDPADPATGLAGAATTLVTATVFNTNYDVKKIPGADTAFYVARITTAGTYQYGTITAGLTHVSGTKARTCDGAIAVACHPSGTHVQIARINGTNLQGDYLTIGGVDVYTGQAIASNATGHVTAEYKATPDITNSYQCFVFYSDGTTDVGTNVNWVSVLNTLGTATKLVRRNYVASHAFAHGTGVFVWLQFKEPSDFSGASSTYSRVSLQNTYFLYRDDGFLCAKALATRGQGALATGSPLPTVQSLGGGAFAFMAGEAQIVNIGQSTQYNKGTGAYRYIAPRLASDYAARAPRLVRFTFDSDEARRTARIGKTLYVSGGEILQYDGSSLVEANWHIYPWYFRVEEVAAGNLADGDYAYKMTWEWLNARGEVDKSSTATTGTVTIAGGPNGAQIATWYSLYNTHKTSPIVKVWRTAVNPTADASFYLATSLDPAATINPNRFLVSDPTTGAAMPAFNDELVDGDLTVREAAADNGSLLEYLGPPAATIIVATSSRLFLGGVAGDPHRIWYSRLRADNEVASFHDALTIDVPIEGGAITGLAFLNETLIVFRETAIYAIPGDGYDNFGSGVNYGPARLLSSDLGAVSHESLAVTPGGIVFKSRKGWYLLNRGWAVDYIGAPVADFDSDVTHAVHLVESQHQVRIVNATRILVWDYHVNQWAEWSAPTGTGLRGACIWDGVHVICDLTTGVRKQQTSYTGINYGYEIETAWIKFSELQGVSRIRHMELLGGVHGTAATHAIRVKLAYDYAYSTNESTPLWVDEKFWVPTSSTSSNQLRHGPRQQRVQAVKVSIKAVLASNHALPPTEAAIKLNALSFEVGRYRGLARNLPLAQKQ